MTNLLKGRPIADALKESLKKDIAARGSKPKLVAIQAGDNDASAIYVRNQKKTAEEIGIAYELMKLDPGISPGAVEKNLDALRSDPEVTGVILQMPLPGHLDYGSMIGKIGYLKDAEGMHPANLGRLVLGDFYVAPCTASACMELIKAAGVDLRGKETVIVGHSNIVGKPLALMLLRMFATTTICHVGTAEKGRLAEHALRAELLVSAVGKAGVIKGGWIKPGAVVIDVGINKAGDKIVGDVEFDAAAEKASYITPVPGGVGPLTTVMLMRNVVALSRLQHERRG